VFHSSSGPFSGPKNFAILKSLPSLRVLYVNFLSHSRVVASRGVPKGNTETDVFAPLFELRGLEVYEVVLRWYNVDKGASKACRLQNDYSQAPFRLTQIEEHGRQDAVMVGSQSVVDVRSWAADVLQLRDIPDVATPTQSENNPLNDTTSLALSSTNSLHRSLSFLL
jgi:hypothetical protein